jgi:nucleoside-diphosphate-sugar epimerase
MSTVATRAPERLMSLERLLAEDLDTICADAADELAGMSGSRVLVTGGGGFLGYAMVQSLLHWNRKHRPDRASPIGVVVYENGERGMPTWLEALRGEPGLELRAHDVTQALPRDVGHVDWILHAAGIASPIHYRARPLECIDANITGLRRLLDYAVAEAEAGKPVRA